MAKNLYFKRLFDEELAFALSYSGAVLIEGPKWCGKTSTALNAAESVLYLQDPNRATSYQQIADTKPSILLQGKNPRLLDEWQMAPVLWDAVRFDVDKRQALGLYILTGSAVPNKQQTAHTGTGRIARLKMRPMSLFESNESNGSISLGALFEGSAQHDMAISSLSIEQIAYCICRGGWPSSITAKEKAALQMAFSYVEAVIHHDISEVDGIEKSPARVRSLLRSLARNIATTANYTTIKEDIEATDSLISEKTISTYMTALKRIFVIEDLSAWQPSLRSKTAIRTSDKRHFVDPSIATAVLRLTPESLLQDFPTFGFLFEALCTRDIRIYAQANNGDVFHYRDKSGLEADLIIRLKDGRWAAIEVKLGQKEIEKAAQNLLHIQDKIDQKKMGAPTFLMVLTGGEFGYQRNDGVWVVPIGCLRN